MILFKIRRNAITAYITTRTYSPLKTTVNTVVRSVISCASIAKSAIRTEIIVSKPARRLSNYRPECPIIACTVNQTTACQMNLLFGVIPMFIPQEDNADMLFDAAIDAARRCGYVFEGDAVVLTAGLPLGISGNTNLIRVMEVL